MGCGGGQLVTVLAFHSDDPSLNPPEVYNSYRVKIAWKNENKAKRGLEWTI